MTQSRTKVLCLDIEGGFGGSSRSLYESISHMQREDLEIEVWCRKPGPIQAKYREIGVDCHLTDGMPHVSSLPRFSRNVVAYGRYGLKWRLSRDFRQRLLARACDGVDVVHFNHTGLFLLARWLRKRSPVKSVMHVRTHLPSNMFSRWQHRIVAEASDQRIYISENEKKRTNLLAGKPVEGAVIYNIVAEIPGSAPAPEIPDDSRLKIVALSNYAWVRGTDRLIDIAVALAERGRRDVLFVVAGQHKLSGTLPGTMGQLAKQGGSLADYAAVRGVADMFLFLGHVGNPEAVLAAGDLLVRPSRGDNPWGREILEAMASGLPVLSYGTYDRFVEDRVTGMLFKKFDARETADAILALDGNRDLVESLGGAARDRIRALCNGDENAAALKAEWLSLATPKLPH